MSLTLLPICRSARSIVQHNIHLHPHATPLLQIRTPRRPQNNITMAKATVVEGGVRGNGGHGNNGDKNNNGGKKKSGGGKQRGVGGVVAGDRAAPSSPPPPQTRRRGEGRGGGGGGGRSRFSIDLSGRFLLFSSCLPALLAFVVGWGARFALLSQLVDRPTAGGGGLGDDHDHDHDHDHDQSRLLHLPPPRRGVVPSSPETAGRMMARRRQGARSSYRHRGS